LVPQERKDAPASELLRRISAEKTRLGISQDVLKLKGDEIPFPLPTGWSRSRIGDVCSKTGSGSTPRGGKAAYKNHGIPFLRSQNVYDDALRLEDVAFIDTDTHERMAGTRVHPRDLLLNITGGSIGRCCRVPDQFGEANISQHVAILRLAVPAMADFLHRLVISPYFQRFVDGEQTGAGRGGLPKGRMDRIAVAVHPLAEQHRIVAKVDELMALCDQLEAARAKREAACDRLAAATLARLNAPDPVTFAEDARFALGALPALTARPDQIKQLRQTIMNLAVQGRLAAQEREDGSGSDLALALAKARGAWESQGRIRKNKDSVPPVAAGERYGTVPQSWAWVRLVQVGQTQTGTSPSSDDLDLFGDYIPFVKPADLNGKTVNYVGPGLSELGMAQSRSAAANSVPMVCIGATLGKVNKTTRAICFNQQINSLTPFMEGLSDYLELAMKGSEFQSLAWSRAGTGTWPIISKGKWEILPLPLPPLAEQRRIVAKVGELMALCDELEVGLSAGENQRRRLLETLLHEALRPAEARERVT